MPTNKPLSLLDKSVSILLSGSVLGMLVNYGAQILMVFFFTKEELGFADTFWAAATILATMTSLRYEDAILLPKSAREAAQIFNAANVLNIGLNILLLGTFFWRHELALWMHAPPLVNWLWMLPLLAMLLNMTRILETWLTRQKNFKRISYNRIAQNTLGNAFQLSGGFIGFGLSGLIGGGVLGRLAAVLFLWQHILKNETLLLKQQFKQTLIVAKWKQYRNFALYSMPAALLNTLPAQLIFLILQKYFAQATVGEFGRGYKLLAIPAALVSGAIGQVFFQQAAEAHREGNLGQSTTETVQRMLALGILPTVIATMIAPYLFALILGEDWRQAGVFAQYLAPWIFISAIASPLTRIFDITEKQKWDLGFSVFMFVLQMAILWWSLDRFDALFSVQCLAISGFLLRLLHVLLLLHLANISLMTLPVYFLRYLLYALPIEILLIVALKIGQTLFILLALFVGILLYVGLYYEFDIRRETKKEPALDE